MGKGKRLKPCPWCESTVFLVREGVRTVLTPMLWYQIRCPKDGCMMATGRPPEVGDEEIIKDIVNAWNNARLEDFGDEARTSEGD